MAALLVLLLCIVIYESSERNDCTVCDMRAGRRDDMRADIAMGGGYRQACPCAAGGRARRCRCEFAADEFFHYAVTSDG